MNEINETTIRKINYYANELANDSCYGLLNSPSDIKTLKERIRSNLLISVKELMLEGHNEEDALNISLDKFGDIKNLEVGMNRLYNIKGIFQKWLFKVTILLGVLGIVLQVGGTRWEQKQSRLEENNILNIVHSCIGNADNIVTKEMKDKLETTFKSTKLVKAIGIQKLENQKKVDYCYLYPKNTKIIKNQMELKDNFIFHQLHILDYYKIPNSNGAVCISLTTNHFSVEFYMISIIILIGYWILFALWASVEIVYYGKDREWIVLFILLNFLGYFIYKFVVYLTEHKHLIAKEEKFIN